MLCVFGILCATIATTITATANAKNNKLVMEKNQNWIEEKLNANVYEAMRYGDNDDKWKQRKDG